MTALIALVSGLTIARFACGSVARPHTPDLWEVAFTRACADFAREMGCSR